MKDTLLHIPLFAAYGLIIALIFAVLTTFPALAVAGGFIGFIREVTQVQAKQNNYFLVGWDFWNWSTPKLLETFIPTLILLFMALLFEGLNG